PQSFSPPSQKNSSACSATSATHPRNQEFSQPPKKSVSNLKPGAQSLKSYVSRMRVSPSAHSFRPKRPRTSTVSRQARSRSLPASRSASFLAPPTASTKRSTRYDGPTQSQRKVPTPFRFFGSPLKITISPK